MTESWQQLYRTLTDGDGAADGSAFLRQLADWTAESGRRAVALAGLAARVAPRCAEVVAAAPRALLPTPPTDPLELGRRLYDATNGPLSAVLREVLTDDAFLQLSRRLLENWATTEAVLARLSAEVFRRLQLATSADAARVATLVIGLDEKVDRLDDDLDALRAQLDRLVREREEVSP